MVIRLELRELVASSVFLLVMNHFIPGCLIARLTHCGRAAGVESLLVVSMYVERQRSGRHRNECCYSLDSVTFIHAKQFGRFLFRHLQFGNLQSISFLQHACLDKISTHQ